MRGCFAQPRDGFADFFGYMEEPPCPAAPAAAPARDGFAEFFGYPGEEAVPAELHQVFLPDRDPVPAGPCLASEDEARLGRQWMEATETSLALVRSQIESKRGLLARARDGDAERLRQDVRLLKLQQARLADALWHSQGEGGSATIGGALVHLEAATRKASATTGPRL